MNHFLNISQLTRREAETLIDRALAFKTTTNYPNYSNHTVANLFYESSTRTRVSFEVAANHLSMRVINLDLQHSSETKGEVIEDTIKTLSSMGISTFVIRHTQEGLPMELAKTCDSNIHIINAGDGKRAHPSQAMLDMLTIVEKKPKLSDLKIAIVGNLRHSRVANSLQALCGLLEVGELTMIAPKIWQPEVVYFGQVTSSLSEGLADADVVVCLRVQRERLHANETWNLDAYRRDFGITKKTLTYAKKDAMVMHPGPINRGVEIDSDVADGSQSYILQQVQNGVFMRMAILDALVKANLA